MARSLPSLLLLVLSFPCILALGTTAGSGSGASTKFIRSSCKVTLYPIVCFQTLSVHAYTIKNNPTQLVRTALDVSLDRAKFMRVFVVRLNKFKGLKTREYKALRDCLEEMEDTIDRIDKSVRELKYVEKKKKMEFSWHMSNVKTWVSAALTDVNTCLDGFSDQGLKGHVKASVRAQVTTVAQVTSNALALVNHLDANYI